nr:hypothetical protein [Butyricicoccus sp. AF10-3]
MQLEQTLRTLCALPAVSGFEMQAAHTVAELFRPYCDTVDVDKNGNVIGSLSCGKEGAKTVLLDAHLDQIGFLVTEVLDGGFLRFAPVGGVDPRMLLGGEVTILADEPLYGVVSCMPPHLLKAGEQNKAVPIEQMAIDTGLLDAKAVSAWVRPSCSRSSRSSWLAVSFAASAWTTERALPPSCWRWRSCTRQRTS